MAEQDRAGLTAVGGGSLEQALQGADGEPGPGGEWTSRDGRRFGFVVGGAFGALAGVSWWRGHELAVWLTAMPAAALLVAGIVIPARLGPVYRLWMKLARAISRVVTPVVMSVIYFLLLTPVGFVRRTLGENPVRHEANAGSYWAEREDARKSDLTRQF